MNIFKNTQNRQLALLQFLYDHPGRHSYQYIANFIDTTTQSIKEDINYFKSEFQDFMEIDSQTHSIQVDFQNNVGIITLFRVYLRENQLLNIIEYIFLNHQTTMEEIAEEKFVSISTIFRAIHQINDDILTYFNIKLKTNPISFGGKEEDIRHFMTVFYQERYCPDQWPFENIDKDILTDLIYTFSVLAGRELTFAQLNDIRIHVAVNYTRLKQGHLCHEVKVRKDFSKLYEYIMTYFKSNNYLAYFEKELQIEFTPNNIVQLMLQYIHPNYVNYHDIHSYEPSGNPQNKKQIDAIRDLVLKWSHDYNLAIPTIDRLITDLHNEIYVFQALFPRRTMVINRKVNYSKHVQDLYPKFYQQVEQDLCDYCTSIGLDLDESQLTLIMYVILTRWDNLLCQLEHSLPTIKSIVISDLDINHARTVANAMTENFNEQITFDVYSDPVLNVDSIVDNGYALIISTFHIPKRDDIEIIMIDEILKTLDFTKISHFKRQYHRENT